MTEKEEQKKEKYSVNIIVTSSEQVIVDNETNQTLTIAETLAKILNTLEEIKEKLK